LRYIAFVMGATAAFTAPVMSTAATANAPTVTHTWRVTGRLRQTKITAVAAAIGRATATACGRNNSKSREVAPIPVGKEA